MRIGVVAYEMEGSRTGVGRALEGLLRGLAGCDRDVEWRLFFKGDPFQHDLFADPRFVPSFDRRPRARPILWEQGRLSALLRDASVDAVYSPAYSLPRAGVPGVVTMHDLSFEHRGEDFPFKERWRRRLLARRAVREAVRVLTGTETVARDLEATYAVPRDKIGIVPLAVDPLPADPDGGGRRPPADAPYLVHFGTLLARRRVDLAIAAFAVAAERFPDLRLVLAGRNRLRRPRELGRWIEASGVAERIVEIGYVAEEDVPALYRGAELSLYLSEYEGWGLPPLESLAAGTPALVGPGLALDDLWPDYPYRCPRLDAETVTGRLLAALHGEAERRQVAGEGRRRVARLTWRHSAERFLAELDRALAR